MFPSSPRRPGRSETAARHPWDGPPALVPAWQGRGIGRLTPGVVVASREDAHPAKVEQEIADQVAALRTIAAAARPELNEGQEGGE